MDKREAIRIAKRYADTVSHYYKVEKVIMFGSYANGTQKKDSDIDLAIVLNSIDDKFDTQVELLKLRTDEDLLIEPHPFEISDFSSSNPIASEILKNGIELEDFAA
ncbi:MAG: nucleotidyltransferase family protein [Bacteroidota bacterium]